MPKVKIQISKTAYRKAGMTHRPEVFRRAGLTFGIEPQEYDVDAKTLKILEAEPMLEILNAVKDDGKNDNKKNQGKKQTGSNSKTNGNNKAKNNARSKGGNGK